MYSVVLGGPLLTSKERGDWYAEGEYSLEGYQAYDVHYEKVGKVDDLFVDEDDQPKYVGVCQSRKRRQNK